MSILGYHAALADGHLIFITEGAALDCHASQAFAVAVCDLHAEMLSPAVIAEGVPTVHGRCISCIRFFKAALTLSRPCSPCRHRCTVVSGTCLVGSSQSLLLLFVVGF